MVDRRATKGGITRRTLLAVALATPALAAAAAGRRPVLGIAPFSGSVRVARGGHRLAGLLEPCAGAPLEVRTAPDFRSFFRRLLQRRYDLALAPAHFAEPAVRHGYVAVCDLDCGDAVVLFGRVEPGTGPDLAGVRHTTLLLPDPLSLVSLATLAELRRRGLEPREVRFVRAMRDVIDLVEEGHAGMGAVPLLLYQEDEAEERARGETPVCVEIARFPVPLRRTLLLAPWLRARGGCLRAAVERAFAEGTAPDFGVSVRRVLDPDPRLHAELARLLPAPEPHLGTAAGGPVRG